MAESEMPDLSLTHLDSLGRARMVDVGDKDPTRRRAVACSVVEMSADTVAALVNRNISKGDVFAVARVAGIQAAMRTAELVPLCHPLMLSFVAIEFEVEEESVVVTAVAETVERTGVEMEALTACSVASLTIYDMCKAIDRGMVINGLALLEKEGGRTGTWRRVPEEP